MNRKARGLFISLLLLVAVVAVPLGLTYREWCQQRRNARLITAVKNYNLDTVLDLLRQGADPNVRDEARPDVSYWQILREWLHRHKTVTQAATGRPAILIAVENADMQMALALATRSSIAIEGRSPGVNQAAALAAMDNHTELTWKLIEGGAGRTAEECEELLMAAATIGDARLARHALRHKVDVNHYRESTDYKWEGYPLPRAVESGNLEVAEMLLQQGAKPNIEYDMTEAPLTTAAQNGDNAMVKLLLKHGAKVDYTVRMGTALCFAAENGHLEVVKTLVAAGADINYSGYGGSVLTHAAYSNDVWEWNRLQVLKFLLATGAKVDVPMRGDWTPLLSAAQTGETEIAKILLNYGADVNHVSARCDTPLTRAAEEGHLETVRLLLSRGARVKMIGYSEYEEHPKPTQMDALAVAKDPLIRVLLKRHSRNRW